jgi:hypothetical protein
MSAPGATTPGIAPDRAAQFAAQLAAASTDAGEPTTPQQVLGAQAPAAPSQPSAWPGSVPPTPTQNGSMLLPPPQPTSPAPAAQPAPAQAAPQPAQQTPPPQAAPQTQPGQAPGWLEQQPPEVQEYVRSLRSEAAGYRTRAQAAQARVDEFERQGMTDAQRAAEDQRRAVEELATTRRQVAALTAGLPLDWADRLRGNTPEELQADAMQMRQQLGLQPQQQPGQEPGAANPMGLVPSVVPSRPDFGAGARPPAAGDGEDMNLLIRRAGGRP